jgi:predicted DNA-binding transcriptional regulator AlpA
MKRSTPPAAQPATLNPAALWRLPQVLQVLPIGRSSFLAGVKEGKYPQPLKLGPATTCWRASDILHFIDSLGTSHE